MRTFPIHLAASLTRIEQLNIGEHDIPSSPAILHSYLECETKFNWSSTPFHTGWSYRGLWVLMVSFGWLASLTRPCRVLVRKPASFRRIWFSPIQKSCNPCTCIGCLSSAMLLRVKIILSSSLRDSSGTHIHMLSGTYPRNMKKGFPLVKITRISFRKMLMTEEWSWWLSRMAASTTQARKYFPKFCNIVSHTTVSCVEGWGTPLNIGLFSGIRSLSSRFAKLSFRLPCLAGLGIFNHFNFTLAVRLAFTFVSLALEEGINFQQTVCVQCSIV